MGWCRESRAREKSGGKNRIVFKDVYVMRLYEWRT
jgi:hypothetical protein